MLRIVLSRAALFPWLGILLMAAGAAFPPEGNVGWILVAIGANVAFYSLRDFSENFEWSQAARPMLTLCGLLFVFGLVLVALGSLVEPLNRRVALLCTGGYLCLFAVWTTQLLVGLQLVLLTFVGLLLMLGGGTVAGMTWDDWRLASESAETPQDITLADLQRDGFGTNRYIRLKEFRFCDRSAAEKGDGKLKSVKLWIPVVPAGGDAVKKDGPAPPVPPRVEVVAPYLSVGNPPVFKVPGGGRNLPDTLKRKRETEG